MAFAAFNRKRSNQLAQLTRRRNEIDGMDAEHVTQNELQYNEEELTKLREAHEKIVNEMFELDDCDEEKEAKLQEDVVRFEQSFKAARMRLAELNPHNSVQAQVDIEQPGPSSAIVTSQQPPSIQQKKVQLEMLNNELSNLAYIVTQEEASNYALGHLQSLLQNSNEVIQKLRDCFFQVAFEAQTDEMDFLKAQQLNFQADYSKLNAWLHAEIERKTLGNVPATTSSSTCDPSARIKLPPIDLPKFNGSPELWIPFRDLFITMVHNNKQLSGTQKYHYLKTNIIDKFSPVKNDLETEAGYLDAWKKVMEYYDDKRKIVVNHFTAILSSKKMSSESHEELQQVINEFTSNVEALRRLVTQEEIFDSLVAHLVLLQVDSHTRDLFESDNDAEIPSWPAVKKFLERRRKTLSSIQVAKPRAVKPDGTIRSKAHVSNETNIHSSCVLCKDNHRLMLCSKFNQMTVNQRHQFVREKRLCYNCLSHSHQNGNCPSKSKCKICQKPHHSMLHFDQSIKSQHTAAPVSDLSSEVPPFVPFNMSKKTIQPQQSSSHTVSLASGRTFVTKCYTLLSTIVVHVTDKYGNQHLCRALLDSGSDTNFITTQCAKKLQLNLKSACMSLQGISEKTTIVKYQTEATISSHYGPHDMKLSFSVMPTITGQLPSTAIDVQRLTIPKGHVLADPQFYQPSKVDMLLNAEIFYDSLLGEKFRLPEGPMFIHTKFGWILGGEIKDIIACSASSMLSCFSHSALGSMSSEEINDKLDIFFKAEDVESSKPLMTAEEKYCEKLFATTTTQDSSGKYIVRMPFKQNLKKLGTNLSNAMRQFYAQESRRQKDEIYNKLYTEYMDDFINTGHMTEVQPISDAYYLPHHGVVKMSSSSTKVRPVFNASSNSETGISLNDVLCVGPTIQPESIDIVTRFREKKFVITGDIAKMYRQVWVHPSQRKYLSLLWRPTPNETIKHYQLNVVTFGTASAPFLATRVIKQIAAENSHKFPEASAIIANSFYVDDLFFGANTIEEGVQIRNQIVQILSSAGMKLCKLSANHPELLEEIPTSKHSHSLQHSQPNKQSNFIKALGIMYDVTLDQFSYQLKPPAEELVTKANVLSAIASIYDPIGWIGPVVLTAKLFMKKLWTNKLDWKDELPADLKEEWQQFSSHLSEVNEVRIPRQCLINKVKYVELHGFCDASINAYGAVIYARSYENPGNVQTSIICSKSRVAPSNQKTLARLELCGATLLAKLINRYVKVLSVKIEEVVLWSDSTIVLNWITMSPNKLQTFVGNRVALIQELTHSFTWKHIRGEENPADIISRGLQPYEISECCIWWNGPSFFSSPSSEWPESIITINEDDPEVSQEVKKTCLVTTSDKMFSSIESRFSKTKKIKNVFAYVKRFIDNCRKNVNDRQIDSISTDEREQSEVNVIKIIQKSIFPQEYKALESEQQVSRKSSILSLAPHLDDKGLIRVGGRLDACAELTFDQKHPIILPNCYYAKLLITEYHQQYLHPTKSSLLSILLQRYWIIKAKAIIRKTTFECLNCFRQKPPQTHQLMGNLPEARVKLTTPFVNTAIDYTGYYMIKTGTTRNAASTKAYVVMFKCMCTGAIHLDVASNLTTQACIAVIDRFVSRRGLSASFFTDNGTCFQGANNELKKILLQIHPEIKQYCEDKSIKWNFTTPRSPSAGGIYESGIKLMKHHLNRIMEKSYTFEQFSSILCKIEAILNSRPLTPLSEDPEDLRILTPGHFLIGRPLVALPEKNFVDKSSLPKRFEELQQITQHFWKLWYQDYLQQMQKRPINFREKHEFKIGTMVLLKDDNLPPMKWLMGRIIKLFPGKDKVIRNVRVKTQHGEKERNVRYLCLLPFQKTNESS